MSLLFNLYTGAQDTIERGGRHGRTGNRPDCQRRAVPHTSRASSPTSAESATAFAPRKLDHAIYEGELAGRELWSPQERYIYEGELERIEAENPVYAPL